MIVSIHLLFQIFTVSKLGIFIVTTFKWCKYTNSYTVSFPLLLIGTKTYWKISLHWETYHKCTAFDSLVLGS